MSEKNRALATISGALLFIFVLLTFVFAVLLNAISGEPQVLAAVLLGAVGAAISYGFMKVRA